MAHPPRAGGRSCGAPRTSPQRCTVPGTRPVHPCLDRRSPGRESGARCLICTSRPPCAAAPGHPPRRHPGGVHQERAADLARAMLTPTPVVHRRSRPAPRPTTTTRPKCSRGSTGRRTVHADRETAQAAVGREGRTGAVIRADPARHHTRRPPSGVAVRRPRLAAIDCGRVPVGGGVPDAGSDREAEGGGPHPESAGGRLCRLAIAGVAGPDGVGANAGTAVGAGVGLH